MTDTPHGRIDEALEVVDRETEYIADERAAFERFRARLSDVDPWTPATAEADASESAVAGAGPSAVAVRADRPTGAGLRTVRTAYRETVLAVPHHESEYDDTLRANLAAEFGADVAARVVDGTWLTPPLYRALAAAADRAVDERRRFHRALDRERDSLVAVRDGLADCERRLDGVAERLDGAGPERLADLDDRAVDVESTCARLADERQELVHGRPAVSLSGVDGVSLVTFLYGDRDRRCPALAAVADCLDRARDLRTRCLR